MRKKKAEKKKAEGGIAEGKPENPRADAQRSDRERRPGSSRQAQGGRRDGATTRRGYERGPKRTRRETRASDAGDVEAKKRVFQAKRVSRLSSSEGESERQ